MDTAYLALIGTIFGGVGLKVTEKVLSRGKDKIDAATQLRDELRKESIALREEIRKVEKELDSWRERYFLLMNEYLQIKSHMSHIDPSFMKKVEGEGEGKQNIGEW